MRKKNRPNWQCVKFVAYKTVNSCEFHAADSSFFFYSYRRQCLDVLNSFLFLSLSQPFYTLAHIVCIYYRQLSSRLKTQIMRFVCLFCFVYTVLFLSCRSVCFTFSLIITIWLDSGRLYVCASFCACENERVASCHIGQTISWIVDCCDSYWHRRRYEAECGMHRMACKRKCVHYRWFVVERARRWWSLWKYSLWNTSKSLCTFVW